MAKGLDIRRRIKSIKSTRSITKAMQMVSASKMRKAQEATLKTRSYAAKSLEILAAVAEKMRDYSHYLLAKPEGKRFLVLVVTSNKGLCGSLNANVTRKVLEFIEKKEGEYHFVTLGRKGRDLLLRLGQTVVADFSDISESLSFYNILPLTRYLFDDYRNGKYDRIYIVYSHFVSVLNQKTVARRLLPLGKDILAPLREVMMKAEQNLLEEHERGYDYLFEPNPAEVLEELLPRLVEMQLYQSYLESYASEQAARMVAMKNATEAAGDLIEDLTLTYNKARQAGITQEISEIVGGAEALKR